MGGCGCHDPVGAAVLKVVGRDVLPDGDAVPAETVDEVGRHGGVGGWRWC